MIRTKLEDAQSYWERCVVIDPKSQDACDGLKTVYYDLAAYDEKYEVKIKELKEKMKANGLEVDWSNNKNIVKAIDPMAFFLMPWASY